MDLLSVQADHWNWKGGLIVALIALFFITRKRPPGGEQPVGRIDGDIPSVAPSGRPYIPETLPFAAFLRLKGETPE